MDSKELAKRIRIDAVRMIGKAHASHIGSVMSIADIVAVLYSDVLHVDPKNPMMPDRDRFILSKGHAGVAIYAALAETGFFDTKELDCFYENGSNLSGHVSSIGVPGVELSTGSLGHGGSVACGMALSSKIDGFPFKVYCLMGDGESQEGSVYEMAHTASNLGLKNLTVIIDCNGLQAMGRCETIEGPIDRAGFWKSLGWTVISVDGHDHEALRNAFRAETERPKVILARTVKGKGIPFMEGDNIWHYRPPAEDKIEEILTELEAQP